MTGIREPRAIGTRLLPPWRDTRVENGFRSRSVHGKAAEDAEAKWQTCNTLLTESAQAACL